MKKTKFLAVISALAMVVAGVTANNASAAVAQVSRNADNSVKVNPATGFPLWYEDVVGGGGNKVQMCLGTNPDGTGPSDPNCIVLDAAGNPMPTVGAVGPLTFPTEAFYWVADAKMNVGGVTSVNGTGSPAVFRMALEGSFTNLAATPTPGQQTVFARVNFRLNKAGAFAPNETVTINYPYGTITFATDAAGDINPATITPAGFGGVGSSAKQVRAQDGSGAVNLDFTTVLGQPGDTGITSFLKSVSAPAGYLGNGLAATAVTGGPLRNTVDISGSTTPLLSVSQFTVAGKIFPDSVEVNKLTTNVSTPTLTGTISDNLAAVTVTVGGQTIAGTNNGNGTWSAVVPTALADGTYDVGASATINANLITDTTTNELVIDTVAPAIAEVTPIPNPSGTKTPNYTFSSTEAGTIAWDAAGGVTSATTNAVAGNNTVKMNTIEDGTYNFGGFTVTDAAGNTSARFGITPFTIKSVAGQNQNPGPAGALSILGTDVINITRSAALIQLDTDVDSTAFVKFSTKRKKLNRTASDNLTAKHHEIQLTRLKRKSKYFFQITTKLPDGSSQVQSAILSFRTKKR